MNLIDDIKIIKGVGEKRALTLNKLNIYTVEDLIYHLPRKYEDRRNPVSIISALEGEDSFIKVKVVSKAMVGKPYSKKQLLKVNTEDNTGSLELLFFNAKYLYSYFIPGQEITVFGRVTYNKGKRQMSHPEFHVVGTKDDIRGIFPIYPLTDGISQAQIRSLMLNVKPLFNEVSEWLPNNIVKESKLCSPSYALENIHFPKDELSIKEAKYRLVFDELLVLQTGLFYIKNGISLNSNYVKTNKCDLNPFYDSLKFSLTNSQIKVINEILLDLESDKAMNRLVQGDVGSGKTIVAEAAIFETVKSGFQACFMAPTDLLAKQHLATLKRDLEPFKMNVALLSGSMKKKERETLISQLIRGEIDVLIGTHALLEPDVVFKNLGLVITDEQHRFGVNQRRILSEKGDNPNVLVMTATPIPRTLAVILYGDLDISIIDSLPNGRIPIKTYLRTDESRDKIYEFVESKIKEGRQAYVVCPLISESDSIEVKSSNEVYEELTIKFPNLRISLLHGALKQDEKDRIMLDFANGKIDILVSTVVIEVGIDVPNATIMVIENSERFGLAQLHQLRGRVGRGKIQSYCILISSNDSEVSKKRNEIIVNTSNGFEIAEEDLKLRGPGELFGTRQHGIPELHIADLVKNISILEHVKDIASDIIKNDPKLENKENFELRNRINKLFGENITFKL